MTRAKRGPRALTVTCRWCEHTEPDVAAMLAHQAANEACARKTAAEQLGQVYQRAQAMRPMEETTC